MNTISRAREATKYLAYRLPVAGRLMAPRYPYKVDPAELAAMVNLIDKTKTTGGAVIEIGVAQGGSSSFLLEHLRSTRDDRPLLLFDTFSGFTPESIAVEVGQRGKSSADMNRFRYTDERILSRNLNRAGYRNFQTFAGDASKFDWGSIGGIAAVLLDIDLYQPTRDILAAIGPHLVPGGGIVVDDCVAGTADDGANQAYEEFAARHSVETIRLGAKGGLIRQEMLAAAGSAPIP